MSKQEAKDLAEKEKTAGGKDDSFLNNNYQNGEDRRMEACRDSLKK